MANVVRDVFFSLLQSGLWNRAIELSGSFPLNNEQWREVFIMSSNHTVEAIVFDGLNQLPVEYFPPKNLLLEWTVKVDRIERRNLWMNKIISQQAKFFKNLTIQPLLLKGQGIASTYINPLHRVCGDIDWYLQNKKDYDAVNRKLSNLGVEITFTAGFSCSYSWNQCEVEHHKKIFDIHNPFSYGFLRKIEKEEFNKKQELTIEGETVFLPSPLLTFVQINAHILKHLLSFGIGMRQLCDSARICYVYKDLFDGGKLKAVYKRLGILKWIELLHVLLVKFIGLPKEYLPFPMQEDKNADWMMEEILTAGNFGFYDSRVNLEKERADNVRVDSVSRLKSNFLKYIPYAPMEAIFFPVTQFYSKFVH
ncbi:nucleotidyltransferase family protein [Sphingobacterium hungaricum]|uniref:Nucleotidyltransferase family protein n=1 Tax=Sphingobacterium hungaricum TaxID=2082723 RepID=A0A928YPD0_9SPHI|nr:nucleotidyltransferase family protein [Sphingobacterium hungaricum]MBE8712347.1 hypothetical protein [Sphingobacterium hungaricum]